MFGLDDGVEDAFGNAAVHLVWGMAATCHLWLTVLVVTVTVKIILIMCEFVWVGIVMEVGQ